MHYLEDFLRQPCRLLAVSAALALLCWPAVPAEAQEQATAIKESVSAALEYHPRMQVLKNNREAVRHERDRARGGYLPRLDLALGYGSESHNDPITRAIDRENQFADRTEASLRLSQLLYDGRETGSRVGIEKARLESADIRVFDNAESIALDATIAHLEVYRQRELVGLAQKNLKDHQDILAMLEERLRGGAGSIADVAQTQARLARAQSSLAVARSNLRAAEANYLRVTGKSAGEIEYVPLLHGFVPETLEEALEQTQNNNPKVLALAANVEEAGQQVRLSKSSFHPKIHVELSSSYQDKVESLDSYEYNTQAMVRLRWNLFNGASDYADIHASAARKHQALASKNDQLVQVMEETRATWAEYEAAREQVIAFGDAVSFNEKTLDAYLKQFKVAQRTLLDVLDARNELFQSSGLLVTAKVNELVAAYRLTALGGNLNKGLQIEPRLYLAQAKGPQGAPAPEDGTVR
jgi:adhesin transport system outer membrane protein